MADFQNTCSKLNIYRRYKVKANLSNTFKLIQKTDIVIINQVLKYWSQFIIFFQNWYSNGEPNGRRTPRYGHRIGFLDPLTMYYAFNLARSQHPDDIYFDNVVMALQEIVVDEEFENLQDRYMKDHCMYF